MGGGGLSAVLKFVFTELHEGRRRAAGVPENQEHGTKQEEAHTGVEWVIGDGVRAAQTIAAQLQSAHPALEIKQQKYAAHDDTPYCGTAITTLREQADGHNQFHRQADTGQGKGEKRRQDAAAGQEIDHFIHAGNLLHACEQEEAPDSQSQDC